MVRVYFEVGKAWVFACAVDYPGWQRRAKGEEAALETLEDYRSRYGEAVGSAPVGELHVVASVPATMTTDFGAPDARGPWDEEPLQPHEVNALGSAWSAFDRAVAGASPELRKGPRGGGRDRDQIADHVREAERSYARKLGVKLPPRTSCDDQRAAIAAQLRTTGPTDWSPKYFVRRTAWHVLDHAWEIEDKSLS